jgi:predicted Zn-dependent protease
VDPWLDALWVDCWDPQRLTLRFEELVNSNQLEEARPLLDRVAALDPDSWLPYFFRGETLRSAHRPADAVREYRLALQKSGDPERILPLLVPALLELDRAGEAEEEVNRYLAARPDSIGLLTLQSELVGRRGGNVRPLLVALLQREPYLYQPNLDLAEILSANHEDAAAVECLTRVAKAFPFDVASRAVLAEYYLQRNKPGLAILPLEQALAQAKPGSEVQQRLYALLASACLKAGTSARAEGKTAEAAEFLEKAARLSPEGLAALAALVGDAVSAKQFRPAIDVLQRLARLQPGNPTIQISLGDLFYQVGETEIARTHWDQALKLAAPTDAALRAALTTRLSGHITPDLFE